MWVWFALHNVVGHPLTVICPPVGLRFHDWTGEKMGDHDELIALAPGEAPIPVAELREAWRRYTDG